MRASGAYRRQLLGSLLTRWNESQGHRATTLEQIAVEVLP
jgi:hemolysin-activating ACP:hemolysin acyltransferase